jgi:hypothetical protein
MIVLLALLWCVYLTDCFVRLPTDTWMFRAGALKRFGGFPRPALQLAGGSVDLAWTPVLPWRPAFLVGGADLAVDTARRRLDAVHRHARWSRVASGFLFAWVMGVLSVLIVQDWFPAVVWPWTIVAGVAHVGAFALFLTSYKRIHGSRPPLETWLTLALSPVSLMRAPVVTSLRAAAGLHPIAIAGAACGDEEFLTIARTWYFDEPDVRPALEQIVRARNLDGRFLAAPASCEPGVSHYCPRCHGTYRAAATQCSDCEDVALKPLEASCAR